MPLGDAKPVLEFDLGRPPPGDQVLHDIKVRVCSDADEDIQKWGRSKGYFHPGLSCLLVTLFYAMVDMHFTL